ncbi:hypothetical protein HYS50_03245 [Candidatus Woesearchaeota archaeon]|nr:hypothetical protein [Candidatus Woesearchaeota archaeon]
MLKRRWLVVGSLSLVAFGYCAGRCGRSSSVINSSAAIASSSLENRVAPVVVPQQTPPQPSVSPKTPQQQLLEVLSYYHHPSRPREHTSFSAEPATTTFSHDVHKLLRTTDSFIRDCYKKIKREAKYSLEEVGDYLRDGGK